MAVGKRHDLHAIKQIKFYHCADDGSFQDLLQLLFNGIGHAVKTKISHVNTIYCGFSVIPQSIPTRSRIHIILFIQCSWVDSTSWYTFPTFLFHLSVLFVPAYNSNSINRQSMVALKNSIRLLVFRRMAFARSRFPVKTYPVFPLHRCFRKSPILA